jgi:hypothetical protein
MFGILNCCIYLKSQSQKKKIEIENEKNISIYLQGGFTGLIWTLAVSGPGAELKKNRLTIVSMLLEANIDASVQTTKDKACECFSRNIYRKKKGGEKGEDMEARENEPFFEYVVFCVDLYDSLYFSFFLLLKTTQGYFESFSILKTSNIYIIFMYLFLLHKYTC